MSMTALSPDNVSETHLESSANTTQQAKSQRVLACILCQQRKIKCDRRFPCAHCVKSRVQCVPATLTQRRRRRRFPERDLLERLRRYEDLLRQNNISFEAMHGNAAGERTNLDTNSDGELPADGASHPTSPAEMKGRNDFVTKNFWHAMSQGFRDPGAESDSSHDDVREITVRNALRQTATVDDSLLFGPPIPGQGLVAFHPNPIQIFKLWQIYLDNISPLLKITHTPTLQGRVIEAAGNLTAVPPDLEALMFGIYNITLMTLSEEDCQAMFSSPRQEMVFKFRTGAQQALWQSQFLRTDSRDCLTGFFLYLLTIRTSTMPQALSAMLGIAIRIAQRMGMHSESMLAKHGILEAEMRRRLWWALVLIDARVGEMANARSSSLDPTWDCSIPLNVNDSDLHMEMKRPPVPHAQNTEALFVVVRCEMADFVRYSSFHLDFINPALKHIAKQLRGSTASDTSGLADLEKRLEQQYLRFCDQESPAQFMTVWLTRGFLARYHLMDYHCKVSFSSMQQTETERADATTFALTMLKCDTKIMTSPLTKGFIWMSDIYFPFVAYNHIVQDVRRRPSWSGVQEAWETMSDNHRAHQGLMNSRFFDQGNPVLRLFAQMIQRGWHACERASRTAGTPLAEPRIVTATAQFLPEDAQRDNDTGMNDPHGFDNFSADDFSKMGSALPGYHGASFDPLTQEPDFMTTPNFYSSIPTQNYMDAYTYRWDGSMFGGWPG